MRPRQRRDATRHESGDPRLDQIVDPSHALVKLATAIDWRAMEPAFRRPFGDASAGRPLPPRLLAGLAILKKLHGLSDSDLCERWVENPYYQHFCGKTHFQHRLGFDPSALTRNFRRIGEEKVHAAVQAALTAAAALGAISLAELSRAGIRVPAAVQTPATTPKKDEAGESAKPVSIYDVAKYAGVSIKTVSLVINRQPNVSKQTRDIVLAAIDALSYRPNVFARGLASERSYLIGMLYDMPPGSYVADLQFGALARCREEGYHLIVELVTADDADLRQRVRSLVSESVLHGVILTPPLCDAPIVIEELTRMQTPFVRIAPGTPMSGSLTISINEFKAAHEMTAYLIGLGHRRIGFIKGRPSHVASHARLEGYRAALGEAGIAFDPELCVQGSFTYQSGLDAAEILLTLKTRPTAIFAGNDDMAAAVLAVSQRFALKIPTDLSVAGFDDSLVAQVVWPRLTTCRQPVREMAAAAVSILAQNPRSDGGVRHLSHELVVRESTASPPG